MLRLLALFVIPALVGCSAAPEPAQQTARVAAPDRRNVTRKLQNHWSECLNQSYRNARADMPDKNAAAETAFAACASEEQDLESFVNMQVPPEFSGIPHRRAETKRVLVEEGHLSIYPEQ